MQKLKDRLAGNQRSLWTLVGLGGRAVLSMASVIAIIRALGDEGYGLVVGVLAFVTLLSPLATIGGGEVLVQDVARDRSQFGRSWGAVLRLNATFGVALLGLTVLAGLVVLPGRDSLIILLFGLVEFISAGIIGSNGRACAALDRYPAFAGHHILDGLARAVAGVGFWMLDSDDVRLLAIIMLAAMATVGVATTAWLRVVEAKPIFRGSSWLELARGGLPFALGQTSSTLQTNIDKAMLLRYGFDADNGVYGAAYRLIGYGLMPVMAVFGSAYPEFFRRGADGIEAAFDYSRSLRNTIVGLAVVGGIVAVVVSPLAAWVFGGDFDNVTVVVLVLAAVPLMKGVQFLIADVLTGSGFQGYRARVHLCTAVLNVGLNVALIPEYSWKGAAVATYVSELAFIALLAIKLRSELGAARATAAV